MEVLQVKGVDKVYGTKDNSVQALKMSAFL